MNSDQKRSVEDIIKQKKLRVTKVRRNILEIFFNKNYALSYQDIQNALSNSFDMVTVYRTLNVFLEKQIIHQVPTDSKTSYYALSNSNNTEITHKNNEHIHFICKECRHTFCIEDYVLKNIQLTNNYKLDSFKIIAEGTCGTCNK